MMLRALSARQRGAVLVELAMVLPVLLLVAIASTEFAKAISEYKTVVNQTRVAARYLTAMAPGTGRAEAICLVRTGQVSATTPCAGTALLPQLANVSVTVSDAQNQAATHKAQSASSGTTTIAVNLVTVTVSGYEYQLMSGTFLSAITGGATVQFGPISTTMRQVL